MGGRIAGESRKGIRILIADDNPIFRDGLRGLLESQPDFEVVGAAGDGEETLRLAQSLEPDVLLLNLAMPRLLGFETLREVAKLPTHFRTVLLTAAIDKEQVMEALRLGARGVVTKESATELLFKSIRTVMSGQYWVGRESVSDLVQALHELAAAAITPSGASRNGLGLTPREFEIVSAIVAGLSNREIARKLSLSQQTVKHHLTSIFDKVGVGNRLELALFAVHHRLIAPAP